MPVVTVATASGAGNVAFPAVPYAKEIYTQVVNYGSRGVYAGALGQRRVHQIGWVGIGYLSIVPYGQIVTYGHYVHLDSEDDVFALDERRYADHGFWDLDPGVVLYIEFWY
jgi:hypothetical protein